MGNKSSERVDGRRKPSVEKPVDGSDEARDILDHVLDVYRGEDDEVDVLYVIDPVGRRGEKQAKAAWWEMWYEDAEERAEKILDEAKQIAGDADASVDVRRGNPSEEIIDYAGDEGYDAIVRGDRAGRG